MDFEDLILAGAFFQAETLKGYRYLDTAGQIMNDLDDRFEQMTVSVEGLTATRPVDPLDHLRAVRVSPERIWLQYGPRTGWTELRQEASALVERLATAMRIKGYSRQGLRTQLLYPVDDLDEVVRRFAGRVHNADIVRWDVLGEVFLAGVSVRIRSGNLKASVTVRPVRRLDAPIRGRAVGEDELLVPSAEDAPLPDTGLLFDADIYDDRQTPTIQVKPLINHAFEMLRDRLTPFAGRVIAEVVV